MQPGAADARQQHPELWGADRLPGPFCCMSPDRGPQALPQVSQGACPTGPPGALLPAVRFASQQPSLHTTCCLLVPAGERRMWEESRVLRYGFLFPLFGQPVPPSPSLPGTACWICVSPRTKKCMRNCAAGSWAATAFSARRWASPWPAGVTTLTAVRPAPTPWLPHPSAPTRASPTVPKTLYVFGWPGPLCSS